MITKEFRDKMTALFEFGIPIRAEETLNITLEERQWVETQLALETIRYNVMEHNYVRDGLCTKLWIGELR